MKKSSRKISLCFVLIVLVCALVTVVFSASAVDEEIIESIGVNKVTLIKNYDGETVEEDGSRYFRYYAAYPSQVTVRLKNGKSISGSFYEIENYFEAEAEFFDSQSAATPWAAGSYRASYSFMGYEGEYTVDIVETPVERITVKDFELYYCGDGYYDILSEKQSIFYYNNEPEEMTVYFKDGSVMSGTAESFYELTGYFAETIDTQLTSPWGIGKHKCRVEYMGVYADYYVTVKESPVKSIAVENMTLYEGIDGIWDSDYWGESIGDVFYYDAKPEKITVYFKNGTAFTGSVEDVKKETGYEVTYDAAKNWSYGNQTASASFLGASTKFVATVKENPIRDVKLIKAPAKTEYYAGELFNITGAVIRVYYTNGKTEDIELAYDYEQGCTEIRLEGIGKTAKLDTGTEIGINDYELEIEFFDSFFTVDINVKAESFEEIKLTKDENGFPYIIFTPDNGTEITAKVLNTVYGDYNKVDLGDYYSATLITDKGNFNVMMTKRLEGYALYFCTGGFGEAITTAFCDGVIWAESAMTEKAKIIYNNYEGTDAYNGLVASDNIDSLLSFAACGSDAGRPKEIHEGYYVYTVTEIQKSVKDFFAVDGIDISLSKYFDAKTNTVKVKAFDKVNDLFAVGEIGVSYPVSYTFKDGYFKATYKFSDGKTMEVAADSTGRITSYKVIDAFVHKHVMLTIPSTAPTYLKTGLTDGVKCSSCGETLTKQQVIPKLVLGKTTKIAAAQNSSAIKIAWVKVSGATGYEVFYKTSSGWKNCSTTSETSVTFQNLPSGRKYTFAVRAYVIESGKVVKATEYVTFETATKPLKPSKVISQQNDSAIRLAWAASAGATGYRVYYKSAAGWKSLGETAKTTALFSSLKAGTRFTFAVRPFVITGSGVIWCDSYTEYVAATLPAAPIVKATAPSTGKITLSFSAVSGAEAYQVYYKTGNGSYKLFKNYTKSGTLNFGSLKSGTKYTFAVRAAKRTSGGWIFGPHNTAIVTVK